MQANTPKLAEGETTQNPTNSLIEYTGVTSCLTFTILYSDGTASGGHAGLIPGNGQQTIDQVVNDLKAQAHGKTVAKVVLAGEIDLWNQNVRNVPNSHYQNVNDIVQDLNLNAQVVRYDSGVALNGKGAHMSLSSDHHTFEVKDLQGNVVTNLPL